MGIRLADIIDLDYFIQQDESRDSLEEIRSQMQRDRAIYLKSRDRGHTDQDLLFLWLENRKKEYLKAQAKDSAALTLLLPGTLFSLLATWTAYSLIAFGTVTGISLAYSFLAYHGSRPINVTAFLAVFVLLQGGVAALAFWVAVRKLISSRSNGFNLRNTFAHTLVSALIFKVAPSILKRMGWQGFKGNQEGSVQAASFLQNRQAEYKDILFWLFFTLASLSAFSFSAGALGGTFFRVIISDMAFGWQSTLIATGDRVFDLVSAISLPWSWLVSETLSHPSLSQIEGSRIILKDGISVLATADLVSWWPFVCFSLLFYTVIPRAFLLMIGILAKRHAVRLFDFESPRFRQLLVRMQSPVLDVEKGSDQTRDRDKGPEEQEQDAVAPPEPQRSSASFNTVVLVPVDIYKNDAVARIKAYVDTYLYADTSRVVDIRFDADADMSRLQAAGLETSERAILVQEVWQPPIRGLLFYISELKKKVFPNIPLKILLTRDPAQKDLSVDETDMDYNVWKKAVKSLKDPGITAERMMAG